MSDDSAASLFEELLQALVPTDPTDQAPQAEVSTVDGQVFVTLHGKTTSRRVVGGPLLREHLERVSAAGRTADRLLDALSQHEQEQAEQRRKREREKRATRYTTPTAQLFDLVETSAGWQLPSRYPDVADLVVARPTETPPRNWGSRNWVAALTVTTTDGIPVGQVRLDDNGQAETLRAFESDLFGDIDILDRKARADLAARNPWRDYTPPGPTEAPVEHIAGLARVVLASRDALVERADVARRVQARRAEMVAESTEWAKLSRSKKRIPAAALNAWMSAHSHVDYAARGYPVGGYRIVAEQVVGRVRPAHLESHIRGQRSVGAKEVLYVARLVYQDVRHRAAGHLSFYTREVDKLRAALPGCVVEMTEDRKAVFVAFDDPQYRDAFDAALVEWVLLGSSGS